jgi:hypothetical protein
MASLLSTCQRQDLQRISMALLAHRRAVLHMGHKDPYRSGCNKGIRLELIPTCWPRMCTWIMELESARVRPGAGAGAATSIV